MPVPRPLVLAMLVALALALGLAACGDDGNDKGSAETDKGSAKPGEEEASQPAGAPVAKVAVSETDYKLKPATPRVAKRGIVEFEVSNDGKVVHSLEIEGPRGEAETAEIQPGSRARVKVDLSKPGTYEMYCPVDGHKQMGMKGEVVVK